MGRGTALAFAAVAVTALAVAACGSSSSKTDGPPPTPVLDTQEQLLAPGSCATCHPNHYREWSGSMHAYASDDPIFRAMNKRMQRETNGALGTFCVQCHAPMAVKLGRTKDGLDLDSMPEVKGVTCFFCHAVDGVAGSSNDPLQLNADASMGAAIRDPMVAGRKHGAGYVSWLDGTQDNQALMCGSCHDIVTPQGAHIERTFREWTVSRFGEGERTKQSCASCHMPGHDGRAAEVAGAPPRPQHDHMMAGVDVVLTDFAERDAQRKAVQANLDTAIDARLCVTPGATGAVIDVALANQRVGHNWPSGSNQDRRAWVELTASRAGAVVFESGKVDGAASVSKTLDATAFLLRDHLKDAQGAETDMFWQAASFTSAQLPAAVTSNPANSAFDNSVHKQFAVTDVPDRVDVQVNIRPIDYDLIESLVASGDLDPASIAPLSTFTLASTKLSWSSGGAPCVP
jgi:hypothetical protein